MYKAQRQKKVIRTRPLPDSQIIKFEQELSRQPWNEIFLNKSVDEQVELFHGWLRDNLEKYFPEKISKISTLDKKWMSPQLKQIHRAMQREFCKHRKSRKHKQLKMD